ncbi:MAG: OmpA family protein [Acidobacteriaceae bacterium]|nr:OmpA family protein [Acidobacteriaceae bacterium]
MKIYKWIVASVLVAGSSVTAFSQALPASTGVKAPSPDLSVMYSTMHTNGNVGTSNCVWMSGGTAQVSVPVMRNFAVVGEVGAEAISKMPDSNRGLSLLSGRGGFRIPLSNHTMYQPFGQALFGVIRGYNTSTYPDGSKSKSAFSTVLGGGLDLAVSRSIWIRAAEVDYHFSQLPNGNGDRQNELRISGGVVFRFGHSAYATVEEPRPRVVSHPQTAAPQPEVNKQIECAVTPSAVFAGDRVYLRARNLKPDVFYSWTSTGGSVNGGSSEAMVDTTGLEAGTYDVTIGHDINGGARGGDCTTSFTVRQYPHASQVVPPPPPPPPAAPSAPQPPPQVDDSANQLAQLRSQLNAVQRTTDTSRGLRLTLNSVLFDTGKYNLTPNAENLLIRVAAILLQYRGLDVHVEGYTDSVGNVEYNQRLSENRARTVRNFLVEKGLPIINFTTNGYGKQFPVASNATASGRAQNRRVDIILAGDLIGVRYREP